jgi:hypothetical protein
MRRLILAAALLGAALSSHAVIKSPPNAPPGAPGSGTVSDVTSTGGTVTVTNPAGPTVNVDLAPSPPSTLLGVPPGGSPAAPAPQSSLRLQVLIPLRHNLRRMSLD